MKPRPGVGFRGNGGADAAGGVGGRVGFNLPLFNYRSNPLPPLSPSLWLSKCEKKEGERGRRQLSTFAPPLPPLLLFQLFLCHRLRSPLSLSLSSLLAAKAVRCTSPSFPPSFHFRGRQMKEKGAKIRLRSGLPACPRLSKEKSG